MTGVQTCALPIWRLPFQQRVDVPQGPADSFLVLPTADLVQIREKRPCVACQSWDLSPELGHQGICRLRKLGNTSFDLFQTERLRGRNQLTRTQAAGLIEIGGDHERGRSEEHTSELQS